MHVNVAHLLQKVVLGQCASCFGHYVKLVSKPGTSNISKCSKQQLGSYLYVNTANNRV